MQYINLNKSIELENKIQDLLLISIDEKLDTIDDKEGVRITGKIAIGGNAKTLEGDKVFSDAIDLDIFLSYEEIEERNALKVAVSDFNYKIENNKLDLDITLSIDGLKEIIQTFPSKEDNELVLEEKVEGEDKKAYIDEEIIVENKEKEEINDNKKIDDIENKREHFDGLKDNIKEIENIIDEEVREDRIKENIIDEKEIIIEDKIKEEKIERKSLLKSVFSNKRIKEEVSWKLHCVKNESSYEQIAEKYSVNLSKLISINKNEKLVEGKLIFIPLD